VQAIMAKCILCKKEVSWFTIIYNKYCPRCWKNRQDEIKKIEEKSMGIEPKTSENLEKEREDKYKNNPEGKRLEQLKSSRLGFVFMVVLSILVIAYSIFVGAFGEGFFIISFEFILGIIFLFIGFVGIHNTDEKIKDLELVIAQKRSKK
jgi:hypothetical protein